MLRLLLADDHAVVRRGLRGIITNHPTWTVVGEARDGDAALALALTLRPDIAVLDVSLPRLDGVTLTRRLKREAPEVSVLLFTMRDDDETVNAGLAAGARGYILKSDTGLHLRAAISALGNRRPYYSPWVCELLTAGHLRDHVLSRRQLLTAREREVGCMMAQGLRNEQIADGLGISVKTVETHRASAMRKAGVRTPGDFVRFAIRQGMIQA
ncbi:response regulator [Brevundimonas goettingensis]|uniref:Response regulator transcription factor n=1 Tax=Brevundimonas goettingensis TaxID=2774190 RepID=A0A975GWQ4_9CAUL|nr:response regulator transcription factor [Brevundimonas goettingensis]QTC92862.1 response regulator transcription factor [Brevundimonas goettingensis]